MRTYKYMEESGRSMIEIIGVMTLMGLISVGALVLIRSGMASQRRSRAIDEVAAITENIRGLFADSPDFDNLGLDEDAGTTLIDALYLNTTTPFGSDTTYSVIKGGSPRTFSVLLKDLDEDDCLLLADQTWPDALSASCDTDNGVLTLTFGK